MEIFEIQGGKPLEGDIFISGAKNSAVAILPATILANGLYTIENVPAIKDIKSLCDILEYLGASIEYIDRSTIRIDTTNVTYKSIPHELTETLRASYYFLGACLGKYCKANVAMPGGCVFGKSRPIDLHLKGFELLGAEVSSDSDENQQNVSNVMFTVEAKKLIGMFFHLPIASVGATINLMLASVLASGKTIIENAAREPHIVDVANFLNQMGAQIRGAGTSIIKIDGVKELHACGEYTIIPDQIEAGTYMVAAAITHGDLTINNVTPKHLESITAKLRECGVSVEEYDDSVRVNAKDVTLKACSTLDAAPYPGFPTDMQPQFTTLLSICEGTSKVMESVWENRFRYVEQLRALGADIFVDGRAASVRGVQKLKGRLVYADDLRAGAAMILAGLAAEGTTKIGSIGYIDRGYEDVVGKLTAAGAEIARLDDPNVKERK